MKQLIFVATVFAIVVAAAGQRRMVDSVPGTAPIAPASSPVRMSAIASTSVPLPKAEPDPGPRTGTGCDLVSPNPFTPATTITYTIPERQTVDLTVFNLLGHEIATLEAGPREAGIHTVRFEPGNLAGGIYFCRLRTNTAVLVKKMFLMK